MIYELEANHHDASTCPVCGSTKITFIEFDHCNHYIQDHSKCLDCGSDLYFQYYLTSCYVCDEDLTSYHARNEEE